MSPRVSVSRQRSLRKRNRAFLYTICLITSILAAISSSSLLHSASLTEIAAAGAAAGGQCQHEYEDCIKTAESPEGRKGCELLWETCVSNKCKSKQSGVVESCPKDLDCESSCTESANSYSGLGSCCSGGPRHNNTCSKKIDNQCVFGSSAKRGTPYYPGLAYREGDPIPSKKLNPLASGMGDQGISMNPLYPKGTIFDEFGGASQPPVPNGVDSLNNPGYRDPISDYLKSLDPADIRTAPINYQPPDLYQQIPTFLTLQQRTLSSDLPTQSSFNEGVPQEPFLAPSTFSENQNTVSAPSPSPIESIIRWLEREISLII
jgi:hypothetical protein